MGLLNGNTGRVSPQHSVLYHGAKEYNSATRAGVAEEPHRLQEISFQNEV